MYLLLLKLYSGFWLESVKITTVTNNELWELLKQLCVKVNLQSG
jgi:hypothetical protein